MKFLDNGKIEIDNNAAERAMRSIAIGRKFFFSYVALNRKYDMALSRLTLSKYDSLTADSQETESP